jgi:hypothetical protein
VKSSDSNPPAAHSDDGDPEDGDPDGADHGGPDPVEARLARVTRRWAWILACFVAATIASFTLVIRQPSGDPDSASTGLSDASVLPLFIGDFASGMFYYAFRVRLRAYRADPSAELAAAPLSGSSRGEVPKWLPWVAALGWVGFAVFLLPEVVSGIAYLAGAGAHATFFPASYTKSCGKTCTTVTSGYLTAGGSRYPLTWPVQVPLGRPIQTRLEVWAWGAPRQPIAGSGGAIRDITGAGFWVLSGGAIACFAAVTAWRHRRTARSALRRQWERQTPAS